MPHHRVQVPEEESKAARGTGGGRAPSEAASERSEASMRSGRIAWGRSEASSGAELGPAARREVIVPMPSREDLGTAHLGPPLARVTLAARRLDPAWTQRVTPGPDRRQRHLCAVWDMAVEAQGVQVDLRISCPCPLVIRWGLNLPHWHELVGVFAYRLVSGHWRVQMGMAWIGEKGTVTTAGIVNLSPVTGWEKRKPEWVDVAWLAMRVHVGRQRKGGLDVIDVEGEEEPPPRPKAESLAPPPPPKGDKDASPPPRPRVRSPPRRGRHGTGQGGLRMIGWSSSNNSGRLGRSALSARRPPTSTSRPTCLRQTKTGGPPRRSGRPSAAMKIASPAGCKPWSASWRRRARPRGAGHRDRQGRMSPRAQGPRGRGGGGHPIPLAFVTVWQGRSHGMPKLRQQRDRCRLSPGVSGWPC